MNADLIQRIEAYFAMTDGDSNGCYVDPVSRKLLREALAALKDAEDKANPSGAFHGWSIVWRGCHPVAAFPMREMAQQWISEAPHRRDDVISVWPSKMKRELALNSLRKDRDPELRE